jgi:D-xylose transport system substrate-binding protein
MVSFRRCKRKGLGGKVFVTGVDAEPRAQELIKQGLMALSNFTGFDQMGVKAAEASFAIGNGKPIEANASVNNGAKDIPWIKILNFNVTRDNLEQSAKTIRGGSRNRPDRSRRRGRVGAPRRTRP